MITKTYPKHPLAAALTVTLLCVLVTTALPQQNCRILILPFAVLESNHHTRTMAIDTHRMFWDRLTQEGQIEPVGDPQDPVTDIPYYDEDLKAYTGRTDLNWVIAGEFQGNNQGWELYFRILDPKDGKIHPSAIIGDTPDQIPSFIEGWVQNHRDFLVTTNPEHRARRELELRRQHAMTWFRKAQRLTSKDPQTLEQKAQLIRKAIDVDPDYFLAYQTLGLVYHRLKKHPESIQTYQKAAELSPGSALTYYNMGCVYQDMSDHEKAKQCYRKALELRPDYREAWYNLAWELRYNDQGKAYGDGFDLKAVEDALWKALESDSTFLRAYIGLGQLYQNMDDFQAAEDFYKEAIKRNDKYDLAWYSLAILYDNYIHDYYTAIEYYQEYIDLGGHRSPGARNRIATLESKIAAQDSANAQSETQTPP
jgi:tetratricopeptide (TPR) repeat protein